MSEKDFYLKTSRPSSEGVPSHDDPELERDYLFLAQWLLDVHRERRRKGRASQDGEIDKDRPARTI